MKSKQLEHVWLAVIAGGQGTRLFPLSHNACPKQFCHLDNDNTFIQATIKRFLKLGIKPNHVVVITTNPNQTKLATAQTASIGVISQNIYEINPHFGYAGAMVKAAQFIKKIDGDATIVNTPADQFIVADDNFRETIISAIDASMRKNWRPAVIVGVKVSDLVTVKGCGHALYDPNEEENDMAEKATYQVKGFVEKPNEERANQLMRDDNSACNTGINVWHADTILQAYNDLPDSELSTDKLMQSFQELRLAVGAFIWHDCGTLKSLYAVSDDVMTPNHKNVSLGKGKIDRTDCRRSLFYAIGGIKLHATGIEDSAVIATEIEDRIVITIVKLSESQRVRELAEDYQTNKQFLTDDFSVGARNNIIVRTNFSEEVRVGFVGVDDCIVYVHKSEDGIIDVAVSQQIVSSC